MFSEAYFQQIQAGFDRQMARLDAQLDRLQRPADVALPTALSTRLLLEKKQEIQNTLAAAGDAAEALTFLYSAMPYSDMIDYPAALFLTYARHGVFLWEHGPFAGRVPEELFANYVLHHRVNNEDIADTRPFFYDKLREVADRPDMTAAALEVNYWCAGEGTYRSTDGRTQNARTMFHTAIGRCGEESTFVVTALRSVGIPARQVYAPLWAHCDDNHAWVEVWCDGDWHFLGACEPEERLDYGWFIAPSSRGIMLHSRFFGPDKPADDTVGRRGMAMVLNHIARYAHTRRLQVQVRRADGSPVPDACVTLLVPNYGALGTVAVLHTGTQGSECGVARLVTGDGDVFVTASAEGLYGECLAPAANGQSETVCTVTLQAAPPQWEGWKDLDFHAPAPSHVNNDQLTPAQHAARDTRLAAAASHRQQKSAAFYLPREAERVLNAFTGKEAEEVEKQLRSARGNMAELVRFLEWDASAYVPAGWQVGEGPQSWKLAFLKALREKDSWDIRADVLMDAAMVALPYAGSVPEDIFFKYLACPRVGNEMLRSCRLALQWMLPEQLKQRVNDDPACLPALVDKWIAAIPEAEYEGLLTSALGCVRGGVGDLRSRQILCVNIYRSLGIPARVSIQDRLVEYYRDGAFRLAGQRPVRGASLTLHAGDGLALTDWQHYAIERFAGDRYERIGLWQLWEHFDENEGPANLKQAAPAACTLQLEPGLYRVMTSTRKPNGDQLLRMCVFALEDGQCRELTLSARDVPVAEMLNDMPIGDAPLQTMDGQATSIAELTDGGTLFLWLAVSKEPTEHILNELHENREAVAALRAPVYLVLAGKQDLENPTLRRTMEALPCLRTVLGDFEKLCPTLARAVWKEPGTLPLAMVMRDGHTCVYSDAGYRVGLAELLCRILTAKELQG